MLQEIPSDENGFINSMNGKSLKMFDHWLDVFLISETRKLNINIVLLTIRRDGFIIKMMNYDYFFLLEIIVFLFYKFCLLVILNFY